MPPAVTATDDPCLTDAFNRFVTKAAADFPQLAGRFAIYNIPTGELYGNVKDKEHTLEWLKKSEWWQAAYEGRKNSAQAFAMAWEDLYLITYLNKDLPRNIDAAKKEIFSTSEHELGHLIAPGAYDETHSEDFGECVATAFSCLRYLQEYHTLRESIENANQLSNNLIIDGDASHFYVPVLRELDGLSTRHDLPGMNFSPRQTANLAYRLSLLYAPSDKDLEKLQEIFKPVKETLEDALSTDYWVADDYLENWHVHVVKACIKAMFQDNGKYSGKAFAAGKILVEPFLNGRMDILSSAGFTDKDLQKFSGKEWDAIRDKIKERSLQEEIETLEQRLAHEARDMMVFGRFDRKPDEKIDPAAYETKQNMAYLRRAQKAYTSIRYLQETGEQMAAGNTVSVENAAALNRDQIIALACKIAKKPDSKTPPPKPGLG